MDRSTDFFESDLLSLMTDTLDAVIAACPASKLDTGELRFAAAKHIVAAVGAGERNGARLERATVDHVRSRLATNAAIIDAARFPSVHRSST